MTIEEFILLDKREVRRNSNLMSLYLDFFKIAFNKIPNCAGCSFGTDWQKLINFYTGNKEKTVTLQKQKVMNLISIKKIQGKILTYRKDGKTFRMYDNILTDSFIQEFVSNGTEEEIKERLKMFVFPNALELDVTNSDPVIVNSDLLTSKGETLDFEEFKNISYQNSQPKKRVRKYKR